MKTVVRFNARISPTQNQEFAIILDFIEQGFKDTYLVEDRHIVLDLFSKH